MFWRCLRCFEDGWVARCRNILHRVQGMLGIFRCSKSHLTRPSYLQYITTQHTWCFYWPISFSVTQRKKANKSNRDSPKWRSSRNINLGKRKKLIFFILLKLRRSFLKRPCMFRKHHRKCDCYLISQIIVMVKFYCLWLEVLKLLPNKSLPQTNHARGNANMFSPFLCLFS